MKKCWFVYVYAVFRKAEAYRLGRCLSIVLFALHSLRMENELRAKSLSSLCRMKRPKRKSHLPPPTIRPVHDTANVDYTHDLRHKL